MATCRGRRGALGPADEAASSPAPHLVGGHSCLSDETTFFLVMMRQHTLNDKNLCYPYW